MAIIIRFRRGNYFARTRIANATTSRSLVFLFSSFRECAKPFSPSLLPSMDQCQEQSVSLVACFFFSSVIFRRERNFLRENFGDESEKFPSYRTLQLLFCNPSSRTSVRRFSPTETLFLLIDSRKLLLIVSLLSTERKMAIKLP